MARWPRKLVQFSALGFLFLVPALNYGGVLYQQYGKSAYHSISLMGTPFEQMLYRLFSFTVGALPDPAGSSMGLVGGFGYYSILGIDFLDPVLAIEMILRAPGSWVAVLAGMSLTLMIAFVLGRMFCGWICPVNTVLEGFDVLRMRLLPRLGVRVLDIAVPRWAKWVLFSGGLALAAVADLAVWTHLLLHVQIGRDVFTLMVFGAASSVAFLFAAIVLAEMFLARRVWCRSLCPTGGVLGLAGMWAPLRLRKVDATCLEGCSACGRICPMALDPAEPISQTECLNCGLCVAVCPDELLGLTPAHVVSQPVRPRLAAAKRIAAAFVLFFILNPATAAAHHMRSQPHYGYAENYPQVPTRETRGLIGPYEVTVVSYFFEGLRRERSNTPDDVQFFVGLANAKTHQSYTGPLTVELWRRTRRIATFSHERPLEEAVYRIRQAVPGPGRYELRLRAGEVHGRISVDVVGKSSSMIPYYLAGGALVFCILVFVYRRRLRLGRKRRLHVASGA